jgi:hypothetical protein
MPKISPIAIMMIAVLLIGSTRHACATSPDLSQFLWKNRLLFLFAPNREDRRFDSLHQSLTAQKAEVADRDLVVFEILDVGNSKMDMSLLDSQSAQSLRKKFSVPRDRFTVILVGKDGGIKLNSRDPTRLEDIFALIDAMPMRQEEMRQQGHQCKSDSFAKDKSKEKK